MPMNANSAQQSSPNLSSPNLQGRTAIVTGANIGLGFQTALQLAQQGIHVILACRSKDRAEAALKKLQAALPNGSFEIMLVDMGNMDSIRAFAEECHRRLTKLDLLCNNAGVINLPFGTSPQGFETHIATNFFGPFALTGLLLDLLQVTPGSRIVNVSSQGHRLGKLELDDLHWARRPYKPFGGYAQSKLAMTAVSLELDRRLKRKGIEVLALMAHPGFSIIDNPPPSPLGKVMTKIMQPLVLGSGLVHTPVEAARCSVYALLSPEIRGGEYIGPDNFLGSSGNPAPAIPSAKARDPKLANALWEIASAATGVRYLEG